MIVPGMEGKHVWTAADGTEYEFGGVDAETVATLPRVLILGIDGRHDRAEAEDKKDKANSRIGEIARDASLLGKTEVHSLLLKARSGLELRRMQGDYSGAFAENEIGELRIALPASYHATGLVNAVTNPSFETGTHDWTFYLGGSAESGVAISRTQDASVDSGEWAGSIGGVNPAGAARSKFVWTTDEEGVAPGERWYVRAKVFGGGGQIKLGVRDNTGGVTPMDEVGPGQPRVLEGIWTVPVGRTHGRPAVFVENVPAGASYGFGWDGVMFVNLTAGNVVTNPSFETGTEDWDQYLGGSAEGAVVGRAQNETVDSGSWAGVLAGTNPAGATRSKYAWPHTEQPVAAGERWYVRAKLRGGGGAIKLGIRDDTGGVVASGDPSLEALGNGLVGGASALVLEGIWTVPSGRTGGRPAVFVENVAAGANYGIDFDGVMFVKLGGSAAAAPGYYFDGDTAFHGWLGTPHASRSQAQADATLTCRARVLSAPSPDRQEYRPDQIEARGTGGWMRKATLGLRLHDPRYYEDFERSSELAAPSAPVGLTVPFTVPFSIQAPLDSFGPHTIRRDGNAPADPVIELWGPWQDPVVYDTERLVQLAFPGVTLSSGQHLDIDFAERTATIAGESVRDLLDFSVSDWWDRGVKALPKGVSSLAYAGRNISTPAKAVVRWRNASY